MTKQAAAASTIDKDDLIVINSLARVREMAHVDYAILYDGDLRMVHHSEPVVSEGVDLHVMLWPGSERLTTEITRFVARESRSYVVSVSGMMHADWVPDDLPHAALVRESAEGWMADGGSCVAGPDGNWLIEPQVGEEGLFYADASIETVARERQNFDVAGHYSRPDVTRLKVNRKRQKTVTFKK